MNDNNSRNAHEASAIDWLELDDVTRIGSELILDMGWGNFPLAPWLISLN